jgi:Xaa-Pro aminopeptidase
MMPYAERWSAVGRAVQAAGIDGLLVAKPCNVSYLTGFTGDSSYCLVTADRAILISDDRFRAQIADECGNLEAHIRGHNRNTFQAAGDIVSKLGLRNVGVESSGVTLEAYEKLKAECGSANLVGTAGLVEKLREVKDETELAAIKNAIRVAEQAFTALRATMRPSDSEKELADLLDGYVRRAGGDGMAFPTIVGVGDRSALPHCPLSLRRLSEAPFVLIDWGVRAGLYHSDLTRVLWARGGQREAVESRLEKMYTVVLEAQTRALAAVRPGVSVKDVDAAARGHIADAGYGDYFTHGLGHGIGLEVHEAPAVRANSDDVLRAGMVLTIEPGIYVPGFGGARIEDDVLVTPDGAQVLTSVPRGWDSL